MASVLDNIKYQYKNGGMFIRLIFINVIVFVVLALFAGIATLMKWNDFIPGNWFYFSTDPQFLLTHPWTIITYMFMHGSIMHLVFNMLVLFFMGRLFEQYLGKKKVLSTYVLGGIAGAVLYFIAHNTFPLLQEMGYVPMVGASASVMAILAGIATYAPNVEIHLFGIFRVKLVIIAIVAGLLDIVSVGSQDQVAHFAHLGGAFWGFFYILQVKKGRDISVWFDKLISRLSRIFKRRSKMKVEYSRYSKGPKEKKKPPRNDLDYNAQKVDKQVKLDAILDKIKEGGYECLSNEEKKFLSNF